jgi:hypothetical protein
MLMMLMDVIVRSLGNLFPVRSNDMSASDDQLLCLQTKFLHSTSLFELNINKLMHSCLL